MRAFGVDVWWLLFLQNLARGVWGYDSAEYSTNCFAEEAKGRKNFVHVLNP